MVVGTKMYPRKAHKLSFPVPVHTRIKPINIFRRFHWVYLFHCSINVLLSLLSPILGENDIMFMFLHVLAKIWPDIDNEFCFNVDAKRSQVIYTCLVLILTIFQKTFFLKIIANEYTRWNMTQCKIRQIPCAKKSKCISLENLRLEWNIENLFHST